MNESEQIFTEILKVNRASLYLNKGAFALGKNHGRAIASVLKRRITGEPLQYILGKSEFMGLVFKVTPDVFIPRPETERLVEKAIIWAGDKPGIRILDLATGSGCIAISLAKFLNLALIDGVDISPEALHIAQENAREHKVKVNFRQGDLFSCGLAPCSYDLIISNPPYIASGDLGSLQPEVQHEPLQALDGGEQGLDFYHRIIREAPGYLKEQGILMLEIGYGQKAAVEDLFNKSGDFRVMEIVKDYSAIDRVIVARKFVSSNEATHG